MNKNIIFLGGIHGVGKGTICKRLINFYPINHITASELLKWEEISDKTNKKVPNIDTTQSRLIRGLNKLIDVNKMYILDGHYCLLNSDGNPERIPEETFLSINPKVIAIVTDDIDTIFNRLKSRDNSFYNLSTLEKMQTMEIEYAKHLSFKLHLPFVELKNGDESQLINFLN